jgi:hypothetical protein
MCPFLCPLYMGNGRNWYHSDAVKIGGKRLNRLLRFATE